MLGALTKLTIMSDNGAWYSGGMGILSELPESAEHPSVSRRRQKRSSSGVRASSLREICDSLQVEMVGTEHCGLDDSWMVLSLGCNARFLGTFIRPNSAKPDVGVLVSIMW